MTSASSSGCYGRPAALDESPTSVTDYVAWLDERTATDGPAGSATLNVCQSFATTVADGTLRWVTETLARDVSPLSGTLLIDGLRALRALQVELSRG